MTSNLNPQETPLGYGELLARLFGMFPALALLMSVKGGFVGFSWVRVLKMRADHKSVILFKHVSCTGRVGIDHENRAKVQAARESGELPSVNQGLPWGEWLHAPYFITHKGALYVRLYPVEGSKPLTSYSVQRSDGTLQPITKAEAEYMALASEFKEVNEAIGCMTLKAENLRQVRYSEQVIDVETVSVSSVSV